MTGVTTRSSARWDFARSVTSMRLMTELGVEHGLSVAACLEGTGVSERDLADPRVVVSAQQELRLIRNLVRLLSHVPCLGIVAGQRYHFTAFGSLGLGMVSSPNARSALDLTLRYFNLTFAFTRFEVEDRGDETIVTLDACSLPAAVVPFVVERDSAAIVTVQRDMFGPRKVLLALHCAYPGPVDKTPYEAFYGVRPRFGSAANCAVLDRAALLEPLSQRNELALKTAEDHCSDLLLRRHGKPGALSLKVQHHLLSNSATMPDMQQVASEMCITARTLRRRLLEEGSTFIGLRDEARLQLAKDLLSAPGMSVENISTRLGYADTTSFINAFKRWTGTTPLVYRKSRNQNPARRPGR